MVNQYVSFIRHISGDRSVTSEYLSSSAGLGHCARDIEIEHRMSSWETWDWGVLGLHGRAIRFWGGLVRMRGIWAG